MSCRPVARRIAFLATGLHVLAALRRLRTGSPAQAAARRRQRTVLADALSRPGDRERRPARGERGQRAAASGSTARTYDLKVRDDGHGALARARARECAPRRRTSTAIAIVDEGTGVDASWRVPHAACPSASCSRAGRSSSIRATRPNVFRIAPTDHGIAFRLAEYLIPKGLKVATAPRRLRLRLGRRRGPGEAFSENRSSVALEETVPADALDLAPAGAARPSCPRDGAHRLGPAGHDRRGDHRRALGGLERAVLHAADRRRPVRATAAGRPPVLGRRAHVRRRPLDRRGRPCTVQHLRAAITWPRTASIASA